MEIDYRIFRKLLTGIAMMVALSVCFWAPADVAQADDDAIGHLDKAEKAATQARAEAAKALAEAQKDMAEADEVIRKAQAKRDEAKKLEQDAFNKMVKAGYYPSDITLTTPNGKIHAIFSHKKHLLREQLKCIECHPKFFRMKVDRSQKDHEILTMINMKKGQFCGGCHNGTKAFGVEDLTNCKFCHPQQL